MQQRLGSAPGDHRDRSGEHPGGRGRGAGQGLRPEVGEERLPRIQPEQRKDLREVRRRAGETVLMKKNIFSGCTKRGSFVSRLRFLVKGCPCRLLLEGLQLVLNVSMHWVGELMFRHWDG